LESDMATPGAQMFCGLESSQTVWMSHGDDMASAPKDFITVGKTEGGVAAAISHRERPIVGLQFHPEVKHSEFGKDMLERFIKDVCRIGVNWDAGCMVEATSNYIRKTVGN